MSTTTGKLRDEYEQRVRYIREAQVMLGEMREFLSGWPNRGAELARLLKRIEQFEQSFADEVSELTSRVPEADDILALRIVQFSETFQRSIATIRSVANQLKAAAKPD